MGARSVVNFSWGSLCVWRSPLHYLGYTLEWSLVFGARLCWGGGGQCDITWYIYGFPRELLYHWCQSCTSGPPLDVACSVVIVISCGLFAGLWGRPL